MLPRKVETCDLFSPNEKLSVQNVSLASKAMMDMFPLNESRFPWEKVCVTGGAVMQSLLHKDFPVKDLDIFVPVQSFHDMANMFTLFRELFQAKFGTEDCIFVTSKGCISLFARELPYFVQLIFCLEQTPETIVGNFDFPFNKVWFEKEKNFFALPDWFESVKTGEFWDCESNHIYHKRMMRAFERGWKLREGSQFCMSFSLTPDLFFQLSSQFGYGEISTDENGQLQLQLSRDYLWNPFCPKSQALEDLKRIFNLPTDVVYHASEFQLRSLPWVLKNNQLVKSPLGMKRPTVTFQFFQKREPFPQEFMFSSLTLEMDEPKDTQKGIDSFNLLNEVYKDWYHWAVENSVDHQGYPLRESDRQHGLGYGAAQIGRFHPLKKRKNAGIYFKNLPVTLEEEDEWELGNYPGSSRFLAFSASRQNLWLPVSLFDHFQKVSRPHFQQCFSERCVSKNTSIPKMIRLLSHIPFSSMWKKVLDTQIVFIAKLAAGKPVPEKGKKIVNLVWAPDLVFSKKYLCLMITTQVSSDSP